MRFARKPVSPRRALARRRAAADGAAMSKSRKTYAGRAHRSAMAKRSARGG